MNIMDVGEAQLDAWCLQENGDIDLMDDAFVATRSQIRDEFRYVKRAS